MKKIHLFCFIFILFLISLIPVSAIGIRPSSSVLPFSPNEEIEQEVCITLGYSGRVIISTDGDLAPYAELPETVLNFNDETKCIVYKVSLPSELTPGDNTLHVVAGEVGEGIEPGEASGLGAVAKVIHILKVVVPYPGKYLTASLSTKDVKAEEPVYFTVSINNKGKENISKVSGNIEIMNQNNLSLGTLPTTEIINFKSGASETLKATWSPSSKDVGTYKASATINYDGNTAEAETYFRIGDINVDIINITSPEIEKGKIGKIDVLVRSVWISNIKDVYAEVRAAGKTIKSESVNIEPWSTKMIPIYFPTEELETGEYPATATVYYESKTSRKDFTITIFEEKNTTFYFMVGVSIVLAIIIVLIIIFFIKQKEYKKKMQHAMYLPQ